jgi:Ser/Thr protein kinase RdoA (MazF antagonist)
VRDPDGHAVIVKLPTSDPVQLLTAVALDAYEREAAFYRLRPDHWPRVPVCSFAAVDGDAARATTVLEDLGEEGCLDQVRGLGVSQLQLIGDALSGAHAAMPDPGFAEIAWRLDDPRYLELLSMALPGGVEALHEHLESALPIAVARFVDHYLDDAPSLLEDLASEEALLHGDLRADNVVVLGDRSVLIDFQMICRGSPFFDLAYLAGQSADLSAAEHAALVTRHRSALAARGRPLEREVAERHYRASLLVCLAYPIVLAASFESLTPRGRSLVALMVEWVVAAIERCAALELQPA